MAASSSPPAVVAADHRTLARVNRTAGAVDAAKGCPLAACQSGAFEAYRAEQRRALSAAARWLECVRGTDKALGESQLSRPLTRATATPSTRMCALHVCRHPCTSALARMLACHMRLCLGRLWDHSKDSCMSLFHPFANCQTHGTMTVALVFESQLSRCRAATGGCLGFGRGVLGFGDWVSV